MWTRTRRSVITALAAGFTGCMGSGRDSTTDESSETPLATDTPTVNPTKTPTNSPTGSESETRTPTSTPLETRSFPDNYYHGPLVSAHEHLENWGGAMKSQETLEWFIRWMNRNGVAQATAFVSAANLTNLTKYDNRFLPFLFGNPFLLKNRDQLATQIKQAIEKYDFLKGLGEFALYWLTKNDSRMPYPLDAPEMLKVYDLAAKHDLPVMIHATSAWQFPKKIRESWDSLLDCPTIEQG